MECLTDEIYEKGLSVINEVGSYHNYIVEFRFSKPLRERNTGLNIRVVREIEDEIKAFD